MEKRKRVLKNAHKSEKKRVVRLKVGDKGKKSRKENWGEVRIQVKGKSLY